MKKFNFFIQTQNFKNEEIQFLYPNTNFENEGIQIKIFEILII